jgi:YbgC/YbaW family acyl-CoA thioester hydrolase
MKTGDAAPGGVPRKDAFYRMTVRVHWADTDAAGIVWFGNFLRYFEAAEDELFRQLGRTRLALLRELGILMPRVEAACRFRSPARAEDLLSVGIAVRDLTSRRLTYLFDARTSDADRLVCEGEYQVACVDAGTMKAREFPAGFRELVGRVPALIEQQQSDYSARMRRNV